MTDVRVAREAVRVTSLPTPDARVARLGVRTTSLPTPDLRLARMAVRATICMGVQTIAFVSDSYNTGTDTTPTVAVPAGAAAGHLAWIDMFIDNTLDVQTAVTAAIPAGFTLGVLIGASNQGTRGWLVGCYKRLTGADTGTYAFSTVNPAAGTSWSMMCRLYSGVISTGVPVVTGAQGSISTSSGSTGGITIPAIGLPTTECVIIAATGTQTAGAKTWRTPAEYTKRREAEHLVTADKIGHPPPTSLTAAFAPSISSAYTKGYQVALLPDNYVKRRDVTLTAPPSAAAFAVTLPTHQATDPARPTRIVITLHVKAATATVPTIDQGFTLVKSGTGGSGVTGADTGPLLVAVYAKDATSSSMTNPTITPGAVAPNSWVATAVSYDLPPGKVWRDAIGADVGWVQIGDDSNATSPLTAPVTFAAASQPTDHDALLAVGGVPTDFGGGFQNTSTIAAAGLANGYQDPLVGTHKVINALNNDIGQMWLDWLAFTGDPTATVVPSFFAVSLLSNVAGPIAVIALRQSDPPATRPVTNKDGVPIQYKHSNGLWYPVTTKF